ncbi:MAG TPA: MJ0042-type zinc finger domain-containing protein [Gemmataceae bacterium]|nr:MJ0042-type zinc finger domain-containing protein [Gemmataceae bacterium]
MPYRINCPTCQTSYSVPEDSLGKTLRCAKCLRPFKVGNSKAPAPKAAKPPLPAAPKPATGRTTTDLPPRPPAKMPPRDAAVPPVRSKKSPLLLGCALLAILLVLGGTLAAGVVAGIYFFAPRTETPVAQNEDQSADSGTASPSQPAAPSAPDRTKQADGNQPSPTAEKSPPTGSPIASKVPSTSTPPMPATPVVQVDLTRIKIPNARLAKYEPEQKRWVYSFRDAVRATNGIFSIDVLPAGAPSERDAYAAKLLQKDFQEPGQQFTEIREKGDLPDGFFLKGVVKSQARPKPEFGFVIVRKVNGAFLRCRSGTVANRPVSEDVLRQKMLDIFKKVTLRTTTLISLPAPSGAVMLPDNVTLVVSVAETANLIYFDTVAEREVKRVEVDFQPGELVVQGDTIFAAAKGTALVYALDAATGKTKKEHNLGGDGIVHLACHPRKGLIYASTTKFGVVSLEPVSGAVQKPKAIGQFLAVSPDGRFLYTGVQPPNRDEIEIVSRSDGSIRIFSDMWGPRAMLMKYAVDGPNLRFVAGQNNAAVNGWWMHLTPDGKRLMMAGGGGWRPPKEGGTGGGYVTAVFSTDDLQSIVQRIPFSGLNTIFHPVLNLGVANSYGMNVWLFNAKSLVKRASIELNNQREQRPLLLVFGARGRKLILWNGDNIKNEQGLHFLPLPLKSGEDEILAKAEKQPVPAEEPMPAPQAKLPGDSTPPVGAKLPPDLDRVPREAMAFCSLRVAETLKRPIANGLRKQLQAEPTLNQFKMLLGLGVEDIERVVGVFLALKPEVEGVALVTTVKPYERERLLFVIAPEKKEMKVGTTTYYGGEKSPAAVSFLNDRTFIVGLGKDVKRFLEQPIGKETTGPLTDALAEAAGAKTLVFGARPGVLMPIEKKDVPPPYQGYLPLLDANSATLTLDAGENLQLGLRLAFADEEKAKKGEQAAKEAVAFVSLVMRQFPAMLEKNVPPEFKPLLPKVRGLIEATATAFVEKPPQRNAVVVEHAVRIQSPDWFDTAVQAAPFLAPRPVKPGPGPATPPSSPRKKETPNSPEEAETALKNLRASISHDKKKPGRPVISVHFGRAEDDDLILLQPLRDTLIEVSLIFTPKITDKGMKHLASLTNLKWLQVWTGNLSDAGLAELKGLTKLLFLAVPGNKITDDGLLNLKDMADLQSLDVSDNKEITDKAVLHLKKLTKLEEIKVDGTSMTEKGIAELKKALPKVTVINKAGDLLRGVIVRE